MLGPIVTTSLLTGVFCAVFAVGVDTVFSTLPMIAGIALAFVSGFLGSLFAQLVLRRGE